MFELDPIVEAGAFRAAVGFFQAALTDEHGRDLRAKRARLVLLMASPKLSLVEREACRFLLVNIEARLRGAGVA